MKIRILNGARGRDLNAAVIIRAAEMGIDLTWKYPFCWFNVEEWDQFLNIVWLALSEYSRHHTISSDNTKLPVLVEIGDGREYNTCVWFDTEYKGLRYVSLYK